MAAKWSEFNPAGIIPEELADLAALAQDTAETLATGVEALATVVDIAAIFTQDFADIQAILIDETREAIFQAVQQLTQTGVFYTWYLPASFTTVLPPHQWLQDMAYSFDDKADPERPIITQKAFVGAICLTVTGDNFSDLLSQFRGLADLFNKLIATETQVDSWLGPEDPFVVVPGVGQAPNWGNMTLSDVIPPIGDLVKELLAFAESITAARSGLLATYAQFLRDKAEVLRAISDSLKEILASLLSLLSIKGAYVLPIYGEFDSEEIKQLLTGSQGGPTEVEGSRFTAGLMLLATGGTSSSESADALFTLFGLPKDLTDPEGIVVTPTEEG